MRSKPQPPHSPSSQQVALYVTCVVNSFKPNTAFSTVNLLEAAGFEVTVPKQQTCCGQPNYNNGSPEDTKEIAKSQIDLLLDYEHIVLPSSSCAGMIKNHYPKLFSNDSVWFEKSKALSTKTWELIDFLHEKALDRLPTNPNYNDTITHHDSCSSLRETHVTHQVRDIISHCLPNSLFKEISEPEACCGFGGTFAVKFSDISRKLATNKLVDIQNTKAKQCTSLDSGCLVHLNRFNIDGETQLSHLADLLNHAILGGEQA